MSAYSVSSNSTAGSNASLSPRLSAFNVRSPWHLGSLLPNSFQTMA
jgi:hypothetical protein